jgi:hypothetical protein
MGNTLVLNEKLPMKEQLRILQASINQLYKMGQGRISFGVGMDGENGQNISGQFQQFTTSGTPDAENTIAHTVGSIPLGFIVLWQSKAGSLYQGPSTGTAWTDSSIFLKCDVASVSFLIFLVKKGDING